MSYEELLNFMHRADLGTTKELEQGFAPNAYVTNLITFAMLVAAAERDACAKLCNGYAKQSFNNSSCIAALELRDAIRARRQDV